MVMAEARPVESASTQIQGNAQRAYWAIPRCGCGRCMTRPTVGADAMSGHRLSCQCSKDWQDDQSALRHPLAEDVKRKNVLDVRGHRPLADKGGGDVRAQASASSR